MITNITIKSNPVKKRRDAIATLVPGDWTKYSHESRANGGYWSARFQVRRSWNELQEFFDGALGRQVLVGNDRGLNVWDGYINEMVLTTNNTVIRVSLTNVGNRIWIRYDAGAGVVRSTKQSNTDSQDQFGQIDLVMSGGELPSSTEADQAVAVLLKNRAWPFWEPQIGGGGGEPRLEMLCRGWFRTLGWRVYNQTGSTGDQNANLQVQDIVDGRGQFIQSRTADTNATQVTKEHDVDRFADSILTDIARLGDSNDDTWLLYVYGDRHLFYRKASVELRYFYDVRDPASKVFDTSGNLMRPEEIRPDNCIQIAGVEPVSGRAYDTIQETPNAAFIESVRFDEESGRTTIRGGRETLLEAIFARAARSRI